MPTRKARAVPRKQSKDRRVIGRRRAAIAKKQAEVRAKVEERKKRRRERPREIKVPQRRTTHLVEPFVTNVDLEARYAAEVAARPQPPKTLWPEVTEPALRLLRSLGASDEASDRAACLRGISVALRKHEGTHKSDAAFFTTLWDAALDAIHRADTPLEVEDHVRALLAAGEQLAGVEAEERTKSRSSPRARKTAKSTKVGPEEKEWLSLELIGGVEKAGTDAYEAFFAAGWAPLGARLAASCGHRAFKWDLLARACVRALAARPASLRRVLWDLPGSPGYALRSPLGAHILSVFTAQLDGTEVAPIVAGALARAERRAPDVPARDKLLASLEPARRAQVLTLAEALF